MIEIPEADFLLNPNYIVVIDKIQKQEGSSKAYSFGMIIDGLEPETLKVRFKTLEEAREKHKECVDAVDNLNDTSLLLRRIEELLTNRIR